MGVRAPIGGSGFCIGRAAGGVMSSAADVQLGFNQMSNVGYEDIVVTRTQNAAGSAYIFSLYFQGIVYFLFLSVLLCCINSFLISFYASLYCKI